MAENKQESHGLVQKLEKHGWAQAENTSRDHIVNHHMVRLPKVAAQCGEGRPKAARQHAISTCIFSFRPAFFVNCFAQHAFQLLPRHVFSAFAQISISGQPGTKNLCILSVLVTR
jgi:hypothetical protein